ncbi:MAG: aldehyde ferredoxin oxidoreductase family protein [Chloroflexi bacterium]|nr:aldehyde ferredoxin oxidoreductase family protein [Chloroflexota bacterium]
MAEERAYNGKILNVHLGSGEVTPEELPEQMYRDFLGGYGIGVRLLFDRIPKGADPLGPDNVLGLISGLMTGTPIFGNRFQAVCKSPSTGGWGDANCGGDFGPYLKFAGWDGILLYGQADKPVYVFIDDDEVSIEDASEYWGIDAITVEKQLKEKHGKKASVAVIGQSGEKLSYMAGICNDHGRLAARSGVGAVMGSKNLKAVVVKSSRQMIRQHDKAARQVMRSSLDDFVAPVRDFFRSVGTTGITAKSAHSGDSPVQNWGGVGVEVFQDVAGLKGRVVNEKMEKHYACWHCPLACGAESVESTNSKYPYPRHTHRPEYETMGSFGTMNLINDLDALIYANHLSNEYGLDTISAGGTISFAIECFENGILTEEDTDGLELRWGNDDAMIELLKMIGERRGIGDVLADGVKVAAEKIGKGSEQYAMHIGGEELPMHDPKLQPEYFTAYKIDPTPARHTQYEGAKSLGVAFPRAPKDKQDYTNRGEHHKGAAEYMHVVNATGMCMFIMSAAPTDRFPEWINQVTDWGITAEELQKAGERIGNLRMAFEVREGNNPAKRAVPARVTGAGDAVQTVGPLENVTIDVDTMQRDFLSACDWDQESTVPSRAKLEELGLKDVADVVHA